VGLPTHEGFDTFASNFKVFAINTDHPSSFVAPDGTTGIPYIPTREERCTDLLRCVR